MNRRAGERWGWAVRFGVALLFLVATAPSNHSEAEDAWFYARMVESGTGRELWHRHHLLYLPLARALWRALQMVGLEIRGHQLLLGVSSVAGAAAFAMTWGVLSPLGASWAAAGLLFSYGFWRYATTMEIYMPAAAAALATWCLVASDREGRRGWGAALAGTAAVCLHLATIPAVAAAAIVPALRRQGRAVLKFAGGVTVLTAAIYGLAQLLVGTVVYEDATVLRPGLLSLRAWLGGAAAAGHTVISGNFVFAIPSWARALERAFPHHMLQEEIFMGRHAPGWVRGLTPVTAAAAVGCVLRWTVRAIRGAQTLWRQRNPERRIPLAGCAVWLAGSAALAMAFEPTNPEMWLLALPPLWMMLGTGSAAYAGRSPVTVEWAAAALLLIHNAIGGFALVASRRGDYAARKAEWVLAQARKDDGILTADSHSMVTYLQYHSHAHVLDGRQIDLRSWEQWLGQASPRRVWVLGEFLNPPPAIRRRAAPVEEARQALAARLSPDLQKMHEDEDVTVYLWKRKVPVRNRREGRPSAGMEEG